MISRLITLLRNAVRTKLFENYMYLSVYQVVNFTVPLIIIPFIIKYTGVQNFGRVTFSYAFVNYFTVLTDYGFNLSATRSISINRSDKKKVSAIYSTVMLTKLLFFVGALLVFCCFLFIPFFQKDYLLHLGSFTLVLAQVLMPVWLFQGMEDMKYLAIANTISKVLFAVFIITLIRKPADYVYINLLQGIGGIIAGIICNVVALTILNIKLVRVSIRSIIHEIKDGWVLFLSSLAVNIYVISNAFILGLFSTPAQLGYYSVAEKVYFALKTFGNVFSQVIFPKICVLANQSVDALKKFQRKVFIPFLLCLFAGCVTVFLLANFICVYFLKTSNAYEVMLIRIFCIVPLIVAFDIPPFQALLAMNKKKQYGTALITGSVINIGLNLLLANYFGALGTTISVLLTELFITISLIAGFNKAVAYTKNMMPAI